MDVNGQNEAVRSGDGSKSRRAGRALFEWLSSGFGSAVLHILVFLALFLAIRNGAKSGVRTGRQTDEAGIILMNLDTSGGANGSASDASESEPDRESSESQESNDSETWDPASQQESMENFLPTSEIGLRPGSSKVQASSSAAGNLNAQTAGSGAGGQTVGFCDVRGSGRKFVYVLDRSDSMNWRGGAPLRRAVSEAVASIQSLDPKQGANRFQVVAFNHDVEILDGNAVLMEVTPSTKARAVRFVQSLAGTGGTATEQALEAGLRMKPDVIFFLTDADEELSEHSLSRIQALRRQFRVRQICVVEFGRGAEPRKKTYRRLAGENNGTYVFKDTDLL